MTDRKAMQQALEALEDACGGRCNAEYNPCWQRNVADALRERLAQPEQEFTPHEEGDDGWSDWVCPDPKSYLMKCCDCGLVHEAQFKVVRYKSEAEREDCEPVDDPNLQAVFRMRRSEEWTPDDTAYRPGGLAQPEQEPLQFKCTVIDDAHPNGVPLEQWVKPPQRKPLTDEEIARACVPLGWAILSFTEVARAIEAAHGIKEKNA